jgi:two-component system KDP operon response regulator KdpE
MAASLRSFPSLIENRPRRGELERKKLRVLLIEHDDSLLDSVGETLLAAGYALYPVISGREALQAFHFARPDLILLGLRLSDMDGNQVLRRLRELTTAPIVVMSLLKTESETISCLDNGADDYIVKPFTTGELLARLRAALRRGFGIPRNEVFVSGDVQIDFGRREVAINNSHGGMVRTHYQLIHELWGTGYYQDSIHLLRVTVSNLRRKLAVGGISGQPIATESGVGYRLRPEASCAEPSHNQLKDVS